VTTEEYRCASVAFSPDDTLLAIGKSNGMVGIWDLATGKPIKHFLHDLCGGAVTAVAFAPDGALLATAGQDGHLKLRDLRTTKLTLRRQHPAAIRAVAFDAAAERIATACDDGVLRVWSRRGRVEAQIEGGCSAATRAIIFAPDGEVRTRDAAAPSLTGRLSAVMTGGELQVWRSSR
jgi:WD40 repeat protein